MDAPVESCNAVEMTGVAHVPSNIDLPGHTAYLDMKQIIRDHAPLKKLYEERYEYSMSERFHGAASLCFGTEISKMNRTLLLEHFPTFEVPTWDPEIKKYPLTEGHEGNYGNILHPQSFYPYWHSSLGYNMSYGMETAERRSSWAPKPLNANDMKIINGEVPSAKDSSLDFIILFGNWKGNTGFNEKFFPCPYQRVFGAFDVFHEIAMQKKENSDVFAIPSRSAPPVRMSADIKTGSKPLGHMFYAKNRTQFPEGHPHKYEQIMSRNGGVRKNGAVNSNLACQAGLFDSMQGYGIPSRLSKHWMEYWGRSRDDMRSIGVACWPLDVDNSGAEPSHVFKVDRFVHGVHIIRNLKEMGVKFGTFNHSAANADYISFDDGRPSDGLGQTVGEEDAMDEYEKMGYIERNIAAQVDVMDIRDFDMDDENIYLAIMDSWSDLNTESKAQNGTLLPQGNAFCTYIIRIRLVDVTIKGVTEPAGTVAISKFQQQGLMKWRKHGYTQAQNGTGYANPHYNSEIHLGEYPYNNTELPGSEKTSLGRAFHIAVDDEWIHMTQRSGSMDGGMMIYKWKKDFEMVDNRLKDKCLVSNKNPMGLCDDDVQGVRYVTDAQAGDDWFSAAKFYGTHPIAACQGKVFWAAGDMRWSPKDYGFEDISTTHLHKIGFGADISSAAWKGKRQLREIMGFPAMTADDQFQSIVYGCSCTKEHVVYSYGNSRTFDVHRSTPMDWWWTPTLHEPVNGILAGTNYLNDFDGKGAMYSHNFDPEWMIFKVNATSGETVDKIPVITEIASGSEAFIADWNAEWAYYAGSSNMREWDPMWGNPIGVIRKVRLSSTPVELPSMGVVNSDGSVKSEVHLSDVDNRGMLMDSNGLSSENSLTGVKQINVKTSEYAMLHFDRHKRNVYIGSQVANLGNYRPNVFSSEDGFGISDMSDNIIIGTKSGNQMDGMNNNIIIGNNIKNVNQVKLVDQTAVEAIRGQVNTNMLSPKKSDTTLVEHKPANGQFAIGMADTLLLEGNLDEGVLQLPTAMSLKSLRIKKPNLDRDEGMKNAMFMKNNILQVVGSAGEIDGVEDILNKIKLINYKICTLENTTPELRAEYCDEKPTGAFELHAWLGQLAGGEAGFKMEKKIGTDKYETIIEWKDNKLIRQDPFASTFELLYSQRVMNWTTGEMFPEIGAQGDKHVIRGRLESGWYRLTATDTMGNGWTQGGIAPIAIPYLGLEFKSASTTEATGGDYVRITMDNTWGEDTSADKTYWSYPWTGPNDPKLSSQSVMLQIEAEACAEELTIEMKDSWGDGWNGNYLMWGPNYMYNTTIATGQMGSKFICAKPEMMVEGCFVITLKTDLPGSNWAEEISINFRPYISIPLEYEGSTDTNSRNIEFKFCADSSSTTETPHEGEDIAASG